MKDHFALTVQDILLRKHFDNTEVIAGVSGLNRVVKWVHVVEVAKIKKLLNGNELILSTGVGWKDNISLFSSFLQQIIDSRAAGLCIEMGTYTSTIPDEIIKFADEESFPIILFHTEVPFVEITHDIHSLLINKHYSMISDLESYSQQLNKKLLTINHYQEILKFLQQHLQIQVIFHLNEKEIQFIPEVTNNEKNAMLRELEASKEDHSMSMSLARIPVQLLGQTFAELIIFSNEKLISEFDLLILDRSATALAQHLLRDLYVEEKKRVEETEWLNVWLEGEHHEEAVNEYLSYLNPSLRPKGGTVCICKLQSVTQPSDINVTYFKLYFRTIFEQQGFFVFATEKRNQLIFILLNNRSIKTWKTRVEAGINRISNSEYMEKQKIPLLTFSVGKFSDKLYEFHKSYHTAIETLRIQHKLTAKNSGYFYEDLHLYRLISLVHKHTDLREVVLEYLEPVIHYDKKYKGKLMETLKTYFACNGSKQETAKKLFIVRQTLYHRLEKLEKLLGEDFMKPEKRLAIEFMILANDYLSTSEQVN